MTEGVWKDSKATVKMEGNKLSVDTTMATGMKWHDEWTLADDGKTYSALPCTPPPMRSSLRMGYGNRRVIVFDADIGAYKRQGIAISNDGLVDVGERKTSAHLPG